MRLTGLAQPKFFRWLADTTLPPQHLLMANWLLGVQWPGVIPRL